MTGISPGRAACEAYGEIWANQGSSRSALWEDAAMAAVAAYIEANGRDPVDAATVIAEAVVPELAGIREQLGTVYTERARLVAFLAACYGDAVQCPDPDDPDYRLLYVTTPAGQMSWHVHVDDAAELLRHVPQADEAGW